MAHEIMVIAAFTRDDNMMAVGLTSPFASKRLYQGSASAEVD